MSDYDRNSESTLGAAAYTKEQDARHERGMKAGYEKVSRASRADHAYRDTGYPAPPVVDGPSPLREVTLGLEHIFGRMDNLNSSFYQLRVQLSGDDETATDAPAPLCTERVPGEIGTLHRLVNSLSQSVYALEQKERYLRALLA